jgi:hypothetical protein
MGVGAASLQPSSAGQPSTTGKPSGSNKPSTDKPQPQGPSARAGLGGSFEGGAQAGSTGAEAGMSGQASAGTSAQTH